MNNDWLDIALLEDYLDGKLDAKVMHKIEKEALEDPFVAQALAGLSASPKRVTQSVSLLQKQLYDRIAQQQVKKKDSVYTWQRLSVAAAAAVMFISVSIMFFAREKQNRERMAASQPRKVEVNMAPATPGQDSAKPTDEQAYASNIPVNAGASIMTAQANAKKELKSQPTKIAVVKDSVKADAEIAMSKVAAPVNTRIATVAPAVSAPVGGWANFDIYLNENNKLTKESKSGKFVELSFSIDAEGIPADIKIIKGAGQEMDDEAVRLIKEGPKWELPKTPESRVNYTIAF